MSVVGSEPRPVAVTDDELEACLSASLAVRFGPGVSITGIRRTPLRGGSYPVEAMRVSLSTGRAIEVFLKDLSSSRLPKDGVRQRREREFRVYRDLLSRAGAGTAAYYGAVADDALNRLCLLLEFVDAVDPSSLGFDEWLLAAAWLGRLQGEFAPHRDYVEACPFLVRHDADFFRSKAELARSAVAQISAPLAARLERALVDYDVRVELMVNQPRTLVHGSFRPENLLIDTRATPPRVCPVDWELAACGAPFYDIAFLADGCRPPKLDALWNAYREGAARHGLSAPPRQAVQYVLDCFYLHKILKALSESVSWNFPVKTVAKLVMLAEETAGVAR